MIVPARANLRTMLRNLSRPLALLFGFDMLVAVLYVYAGWTWLSLPHIPLSILGGAIGVIVGFRNNSSYQRWWEARTLWGSIVNNSRTLARQVLTLLSGGTQGERAAAQRKVIRLQIAYAHALRLHLRGQTDWVELGGLLDAEEVRLLQTERNVPLAIQQRIAEQVKLCFEAGWLDSVRWASIDRTLGALANAQGGAERIKNTPMPKQYDFFPQLFVSLYCLLLPLGLVANLGLLTPVGSSLAGFIFLALDEIGRNLEGPFDNNEHDLPLTSITRTIEINLKQLAGDEAVPEAEKAIDGVLW